MYATVFLVSCIEALTGSEIESERGISRMFFLTSSLAFFSFSSTEEPRVCRETFLVASAKTQFRKKFPSSRNFLIGGEKGDISRRMYVEGPRNVVHECIADGERSQSVRIAFNGEFAQEIQKFYE